MSAAGDAGTGRRDLGIFARTFPRSSAGEVATAVSAAGYGLVQLNLSAVGLPTLPAPAEHGQLDFGPVRQAFDERGIGIWGLSASYNMIHPDPAVRAAQTEAAVALIGRAPELGATAVTLCTGSRDPDNMWRRHPGNDEPAAWHDLRASLDRLLPAAAAAGVGIIVRVPLASGLLAARYTLDTAFASDDHRTYNRHGEAFDVGETFSGVDYPTGVQAATEFAAIVAEPGAFTADLTWTPTTAQAALRWVTQQPGVTTVIPGARNTAQARQNAAAGDLPRLSEPALGEIEDLYDKYFRAEIHARW